MQSPLLPAIRTDTLFSLPRAQASFPPPLHLPFSLHFLLTDSCVSAGDTSNAHTQAPKPICTPQTLDPSLSLSLASPRLPLLAVSLVLSIYTIRLSWPESF